MMGLYLQSSRSEWTMATQTQVDGKQWLGILGPLFCMLEFGHPKWSGAFRTGNNSNETLFHKVVREIPSFDWCIFVDAPTLGIFAHDFKNLCLSC